MIQFNKDTLSEFLLPLKDNYIHASNIYTKLKDGKSLDFLFECAGKYADFHNKFSTKNLEESVSILNTYKNFVHKNNNNIFSAQSKFESTILEECMYRLFREFENEVVKIGNIKAYSNLYFSPLDFADFQNRSSVKINVKDQDFAIYKKVQFTIQDSQNPIITFVPVVAIECKTYLDKTMLEGSIATAEKIKNGNPYCKFCIVTEYYEVDKGVDVKHSRIDQIYVLNKNAKRKSSISNISIDVVYLLYNDIKQHLVQKWSDVEASIEEKGVVLC